MGISINYRHFANQHHKSQVKLPKVAIYVAITVIMLPDFLFLLFFSEFVQCRQTLKKPSSAKQPLRRSALMRLRKEEKAKDPLVGRTFLWFKTQSNFFINICVSRFKYVFSE